MVSYPLALSSCADHQQFYSEAQRGGSLAPWALGLLWGPKHSSHQEADSFFLLSHISHSCLLPGSTSRAGKLGILVKFRQGDSLLDKGLGRGNQCLIVCAICWLLETSCLAFFILLFSSVKTRRRHVLLWFPSMDPRTTEVSTSKEGVHPWTNISLTLITTCGTCLPTLGERLRWCL